MKIKLYALLLLFSVVSCQKNDEAPNEKTVYTASYTVSPNVCNHDYGFRLLHSTGTLMPSFEPDQSENFLELELVVNLCSDFSFSFLPETIPAVIYRNGEIFLSVDLIQSVANSRRYIYHFHHYK
jgi:hypothetical protein